MTNQALEYTQRHFEKRHPPEFIKRVIDYYEQQRAALPVAGGEKVREVLQNMVSLVDLAISHYGLILMQGSKAEGQLIEARAKPQDGGTWR